MLLYMSRRGIESNPWNVPEEDLTEWSLRFSGFLPDLIQSNNLHNVEDDVISSMSSEETTALMDDDNSTTLESTLLDMDMSMDNDDEWIQHEEITSSTPTITSLNTINSMQNNAWMLQPALNSIYHSMDPVPACHNKSSTGSYQMSFDKPYDNALMTPLAQNVCMVKRGDICPMMSIQSSLYNLMLAMQHYESRKPAEKETLISNFTYLAQLVSSMENGLRAQREWNTIIQSLHHRSDHFQSNATNLEFIDLPRMVRSTMNRCPGLSINDQIPITTLFDQFQKQSPSSSSSNIEWSEKEILAHKMFQLIVNIDKMTTEIRNNNISFM